MAQYTITLNSLLEFAEFSNDIGLNDYPIFDENHREVLNTKILNRYDAREIGFETGEGFRFALSRRMHEIMPMYNQLYESELLAIDPLNTLKMHSTDSSNAESSETSSATSSTESVSDAHTLSVAYTMPQVALAGNRDYADNAADSDNNGTSTAIGENEGNATNESSTSSTSDVEGFQGSQADLLQRYRATFLNIDLQIIENLSDLFMQIWDSGAYFEPYTPRYNSYYNPLGWY